MLLNRSFYFERAIKAVTHLGAVTIHLENEPLLDNSIPSPLLKISIAVQDFDAPNLQEITPYITRLLKIQQLSIIKHHVSYNDLKIATDSLYKMYICFQQEEPKYSEATQISNFGIMPQQRTNPLELGEEKLDDFSALPELMKQP